MDSSEDDPQATDRSKRNPCNDTNPSSYRDSSPDEETGTGGIFFDALNSSYLADSQNGSFVTHYGRGWYFLPRPPTRDYTSGTVVRPEEVGVLLVVFVLWMLAVALFFNRWGKIRMLEPYVPPSYAYASSVSEEHRSSLHQRDSAVGIGLLSNTRKSTREGELKSRQHFSLKRLSTCGCMYTDVSSLENDKRDPPELPADSLRRFPLPAF
ncbi:unnamed protein product [Cyprideis torosa]|uniref:Uncharacterized protein n=1 Tax=Cyprideis torosa TaxID=163714 RepID=A0A7R8ZKD3_9CRUS|nr:unnamed protein product [Cyprideis torosa]CAG0884233.1 unnamed protein product [Cyprideis torosa]